MEPSASADRTCIHKKKRWKTSDSGSHFHRRREGQYVMELGGKDGTNYVEKVGLRKVIGEKAEFLLVKKRRGENKSDARKENQSQRQRSKKRDARKMRKGKKMLNI